MFVVLALVGLFVSVFIGMMFANRSIQRHIHIVSKKTMTKDLVVKDLAPGAVETMPCTEIEQVSDGAHEQHDQGDIETGFLMTNTYNSMRRDD